MQRHSIRPQPFHPRPWIRLFFIQFFLPVRGGLCTGKISHRHSGTIFFSRCGSYKELAYTYIHREREKQGLHTSKIHRETERDNIYIHSYILYIHTYIHRRGIHRIIVNRKTLIAAVAVGVCVCHFILKGYP